jgi:formylglycine-generating enzyme required for sulfatase activity
MATPRTQQPSEVSPLSELLGWLAAWPTAEESLTATELADLLWLARSIPPATRPTTPSSRDASLQVLIPPEDQTAHQKQTSTAPEHTDTYDPPPPPEDDEPPAFFPEAPPARSPDRVAHLLPDRVMPRQKELAEAIASLPVRLQAPRLLSPEPVLLAALRPLLGHVTTAASRELDEEATAERCAEERLPLPVYGGRAEPRFSFTLLVDRGLVMEVWQPLAQELCDLLTRCGAFSDVRLVELIPPQGSESDAPLGLRYQGARQVVWKSPHALRRSPAPAAAQAERSLMLVLSDTAGPHWWDGLMFDVLAAWSHQVPLAILHTLPRWLAERTALRALSSAEIRNTQASVSTSHYLVRDSDGWDETIQRGGALPVLRLEPGALAPWAAMVMGDGRMSIGGVRIPADRDALERQLEPLRPLAIEPAVAESSSAENLWHCFCRSASPEAQRLMVVLAAAPVLSLPVMRLIKEAMLPSASGPLPLQEVLLSGLVKPMARPAKGEPSDLSADTLQYAFDPGVLALLRSDLSTADTVAVVRMVTGLLERRWNALGQAHSFRALLRDPDLEIDDDDLKGVVNFATATAELIGRLPGEEYQRFAQQLRGRSPKQIWPDFIHFESLSFNTALLVAAPELQPIRFETGRLYNMPLQPIPGAPTWGFREPLLMPALTLVQIPAGSFLMGSPPDEPQRADDEGPQHTVELASFFISQTPITQGQWREVAQWKEREGERWERELEANPSRFQPKDEAEEKKESYGSFRLLDGEASSDQRPVERVSWLDAMEFCNRLSQRTGRHYTLPSEAQWEYACRAGTITPFAFGETLSDELANYDASETYGNGLKGKNRKQTTPVGMFPANAWGLQDMHGNVREWCLDDWHGSYEGAPVDGSAWLDGAEGQSSKREGGGRLLRGGSWSIFPGRCRSAFRYPYRPDDAYSFIGFRVVCLPQGPSLNA